MTRMVALVIVFAASSCHEADTCERALARLDRIRPTPASRSSEMLEACRHGKYASYDPVLRCAMDSDSDDAAAACIDKFLKAVVKPSPAGGSGVNPLLDH